MALVTLSPPIDGLHPSCVVNGRSYTCPAGQTISVPDFDAIELEANHWSVAGTTNVDPSNHAYRLVQTPNNRNAISLPSGVYLFAPGSIVSVLKSYADEMIANGFAQAVGASSPGTADFSNPANSDLIGAIDAFP